MVFISHSMENSLSVGQRHNDQAQPRRVSGVGWSAGLGACTCSLKVINAWRYNSEPWKVENLLAPLLEIVRILSRKTPVGGDVKARVFGEQPL